MASQNLLYQIANPKIADIQGQYAAGQQQQNALAEIARAQQARELYGQAAGGDQNALAPLAGVDPALHNAAITQQRAQGEYDKKAWSEFRSQAAAGLSAAKTQEQLTAAIDSFERQGRVILKTDKPIFSPEERDINNLDTTLAQFDDIKEVRKQERQYGYDIRKERAKAEFSPEAPVEVGDPTSPTGSRMLSRRDAIGKPGKPGSKGFDVEFNPDGTISRISQGGTDGLQKPTRTALEEKTLKASDNLSRLASIKAAFDPKFLQLGERLKQTGLSWKDFSGVGLQGDEKKSVEEFATFKRRSVDNLSRVLNELSGAAVTPQEYERIKSTQPNAGTSIFDGDAPVEFKAKLDDTMMQTRSAVLRYNFAKSNGMNPLKTGMELQDVPAFIDKRGAEIEAELLAGNPNADPAAIKKEAHARVAKEFGM